MRGASAQAARQNKRTNSSFLHCWFYSGPRQLGGSPLHGGEGSSVSSSRNKCSSHLETPSQTHLEIRLYLDTPGPISWHIKLTIMVTKTWGPAIRPSQNEARKLKGSEPLLWARVILSFLVFSCDPGISLFCPSSWPGSSPRVECTSARLFLLEWQVHAVWR